VRITARSSRRHAHRRDDRIVETRPRRRSSISRSNTIEMRSAFSVPSSGASAVRVAQSITYRDGQSMRKSRWGLGVRTGVMTFTMADLWTSHGGWRHDTVTATRLWNVIIIASRHGHPAVGGRRKGARNQADDPLKCAPIDQGDSELTVLLSTSCCLYSQIWQKKVPPEMTLTSTREHRTWP